jgi:hypothetical protein
MKKKVITIVLAALLIYACSDNDDNSDYPSLLTELVDAHTGGNARVSSIITDNGTTYYPTSSISTSTADTTFRCLCSFSISEEDSSKVNVYNIAQIFSQKAVDASKIKDTSSDPVNIVSVWKSKRYINTTIGILTNDEGSHKYAFCIDSISCRTAYIRLIHHKPDEDRESYTKKVNLSLPLYNLKDIDNVEYSIQAYDSLHSFLFNIE